MIMSGHRFVRFLARCLFRTMNLLIQEPRWSQFRPSSSFGLIAMILSYRSSITLGSNNGAKAVKARCSVWLSRDLLKPTVKFVDEYCQWYQPLFAEVRSFEAFKQLHLDSARSNVNRCPPSPKAGLDNAQSLHHFLTESPWQILFSTTSPEADWASVGWARNCPGHWWHRRPEKGQHTDYVKRQYISNLGKIENGIVAAMGSLIILRFLARGLQRTT